MLNDQKRGSQVWHYRKAQILGVQFQAVEDGLKDIKWEKVFTKNKGLVRSSAWYTRNGCSCTYKYSKKEWAANDFTPWMDQLCKEVAVSLKLESVPNSINFNYYRDGSQGIPWHSDDEELFRTKHSADTTIVSISFGDTRDFQIKDKYEQDSKAITLKLQSGDIVIMKGKLQQHYEHRVPEIDWADMLEGDGRYNITLRTIVSPLRKCKLCNS